VVGMPCGSTGNIQGKEGRIHVLASIATPCQTAGSLFRVIHEQAMNGRGIYLSTGSKAGWEEM
jgi:hypothetical protein